MSSTVVEPDTGTTSSMSMSNITAPRENASSPSAPMSAERPDLILTEVWLTVAAFLFFQ